MISLYILFLLCFSFQGSFLWEDGVVLKSTEFCGTALSMDLPSSVILFRFCFGGHSRVKFRSHGLWYSACSLVILSWCKGWFWVSVSLIFMTLPFNFHVHIQGTSGSSILSEESWLGSTGDVLLASGVLVVLFFSVHLLLLMGSPCFSMAFFFLAYCLPLTLCSHFLDIVLCMVLNNNPHFLATSFIFLA